MRFNIGIAKLKGYHFVDVDITKEEWVNGNHQENHKKVMNAIFEKYKTKNVMGYAINETLDNM